MKKSKLPPLGSVFLVPLRDRAYARGVLARASGRGAAYGYFFGPRVSRDIDVPLEDLRADNALWVGKFGDLEILRQNWPVVSAVDAWNPASWPMSSLSRVDEAAGRAWLSTYDDRLECVKEIEIDRNVASRYPSDGLMGAGAVEIRLTKLIKLTEN